MFEHTWVGQKNSGVLKTPLFDIDAIGELIAAVVAQVVFHGAVADVIHKAFAEQHREMGVYL